ncbi:CDP-alcohol phosphatidyltransferase family protein [Luteimonas lutimaris]|uniref:CDP-alcohol phosphatidyltransferase family protein n=1 Tax=Luteimonas lutimaris TaxID=698645 RepID=A0ABP7MZU2_9GAMM
MVDEASTASESGNRRPIAARGNALVQRFSTLLARSGVSPNAISVLSIGFAALGAWALLRLDWPWGPWLCAVAIVLRLLCNLFDGLVAVEHGRKTPTGVLYNEVPDRLADSLFLIALGYAAGLPWCGWLAALLAALTAYVRTLGGTVLDSQDFRGPMAKPHRMWLMVAACVAAPLEAWFAGTGYALRAAVVLVAAGSALTCWTRLRAIANRLREAA